MSFSLCPLCLLCVLCGKKKLKHEKKDFLSSPDPFSHLLYFGEKNKPAPS